MALTPKPTRRRQWLAAALVCSIVILLALLGGAWPFDSPPVGIENQPDPSIWQYLLGDRSTLGFVRLAIVFASLFLIASVVALAVAGRWMTGFGRFSVDDRETVEDVIEELETQLRRTAAELKVARRERKDAQEVADFFYDALMQTLPELESCREEVSSLRGGAE